MKKLTIGASLAVMLMLLIGGSAMALDEDQDGDYNCYGYCQSSGGADGYYCR